MVINVSKSWMQYVLAGVCVVAVITITVLAYKQSVQTAKLRAQLTQMRYDVSRLDAIIRDTQTYKQPINALLASLPLEHRDVAQALIAFERTAGLYAIGLDMRVDDMPKTDPSGMKSLTITMQATGTYQSLLAFLTGLSRLPYHTRISTMSVDTTGGPVSALVAIKLFVH